MARLMLEGIHPFATATKSVCNREAVLPSIDTVNSGKGDETKTAGRYSSLYLFPLSLPEASLQVTNAERRYSLAASAEGEINCHIIHALLAENIPKTLNTAFELRKHTRARLNCWCSVAPGMAHLLAISTIASTLFTLS